MMKKVFFLFLLVPLVLISGCTTAPQQVSDENIKQASVQNAQLGLGYMQQGRYEVALKKLNKAIAQDENNPDAHHYMAELYRRLDRPVDAERHYQIALDILPDDTLSSHVASVRNNYAVFLCEQKKYAEAKTYFDKALKDPLYQQKAQLHENMGLCEMHKGSLHQAEISFLKALKENPKLSKSLLAMAQINFDKQLYRQAELYLNQYLTNARHNAQSLWLALLMERQKGKAADKDKIANYSVRLKGKFPDSREAMLLRQLERRGKL